MDDQLIIEQYVAGKLTPDERVAFEKRLAQEQDLAESLRLYQMTQGFMAQREPALEQLLNTMGDKYFPVRSWYQKWYLWLVFCLLIVIAVTIILLAKPPLSTPPSPGEEVPTADQNTPTAPSSVPDHSAVADAVDTVVAAPPAVAPQPSKLKPPPSIASLNASAFEENPTLESLWREQLRNHLYFELLKPLRDTTFLLQSQTTFRLNARTTSSPPYELRIYSNHPEAFYNDEQVSNTLIVEANRLSDTFTIDQAIHLPLRPGLYYWLLVSKSDKLLTVGKFKIVEF